MMQKLVIPGIFFFVTLASGIILTKMGRPYHFLTFQIHKLMALAGVVLAFRVLRTMLAGGIAGTAMYAALVAAFISIIALFVSGALLSGTRAGALVVIHGVAPVTLLLAVAFICIAANKC